MLAASGHGDGALPGTEVDGVQAVSHLAAHERGSSAKAVARLSKTEAPQAARMPSCGASSYVKRHQRSRPSKNVIRVVHPILAGRPWWTSSGVRPSYDECGRWPL